MLFKLMLVLASVMIVVVGMMEGNRSVSTCYKS